MAERRFDCLFCGKQWPEEIAVCPRCAGPMGWRDVGSPQEEAAIEERDAAALATLAEARRFLHRHAMVVWMFLAAHRKEFDAFVDNVIPLEMRGEASEE